MFTPHQACRACGFGFRGPGGIKAGTPDNLTEVFDLGLQPLANDFVPDGAERSGYAPLKVMHCPRCTLAQLSVTVRPDILYRHYNYVTSSSETMKHHFERLADDLRLLMGGHTGTVIEVGSNDGLLLQFLSSKGFGNVCGIDPAENLAHVANTEKGVQTINGLFDVKTAAEAKSMVGTLDAIVARHVFCHVDSWEQFLNAALSVCDDHTVLCIEVPYCKDMLEKVEFDTIYHEHTSYMTIRAMKILAERMAFKLVKVIRYQIHGGALLLVLAPERSLRPVDPSVKEFLDAEEITLDTWKEFSAKAKKQIATLRSFVQTARQNGKRVAGFGASAKSTVWINACGFTRKDLETVYDNTSLKWWKLSPGTDIPVTPEGGLYVDSPDYLICFAWNFAQEIMEKPLVKKWMAEGGKFVVPVPELKVYPAP